MALNSEQIRQQFPAFEHDDTLVYLDSAATAQVPVPAMEAMNAYYTSYKANVHRGVHAKVDEATNAYERARTTVQQFMNAKKASEILFTKNCTEAINLVAQSWAKHTLQKGDVVLLSIFEHHSNIVPWQQLQNEIGIEIRWWKQLDEEPKLDDVKLVAITGQSNVTGERPDIQTLCRKAQAAGAKVLIDAAQLIAHHAVDVQEIDCDWLAFSGHKLYGPTGIGVLYAKEEVQQQMQPYQGGGGMIVEVHEQDFVPTDGPAKFEAGTPPIAEVIGLSAAIEWLNQFDWNDIEAYEKELSAYAYKKLSTIDQLSIINYQLSIEQGSPTTTQSFVIEGIHPHDLTDILGQKNIHLRAGHHCAQPLHEHLGIPATTRLSLALYNTKEDVDKLCAAIAEAKEILQINR